MADALYNAILGEETPKAVSSSSAGGGVITDQILDSLKRVESGKDKYALNKESKAMGSYQFIPETVQMLHKQGIEFNPFNEKESRQAAKTYLEQLVKQKGSVEGALAAYGGHITKDPTAYVNNVMGGAKNETKPASNDALYNAILGGELTAQPTAQTSAKTEEVKKPLSFMDKFAQTMGKAKETNEPLVGLGEAITSNIVNPLTQLAGNVKGIVQSVPEAIKTGQAPAPIGEKIASEFAAKHTYEPKTETGKAINEFISAIPEKVTGSHMGVGPLPETMGILATPKETINVKGAKAEIGKQFEKRFPKIEEAIVSEQPQAALAGVGAAKSEMNPYGVLTGEEKARGEYPVVKLSKTPKDVAPTEQSTRAKIANEILGPDSGVREGVLTANEDTLRNEHALAKSTNGGRSGEILKEQIANEQNALSEYAKKRIENTGADQHLQNDYERGERLSNAFVGDEGATGFIKKAKNAIYEDARATVGDKPIPSGHVESLFENPQFKAGAGLKGNEGVLKSAESLIKLAKETGFEDEFGNKFAPNTVGAWDAVKKSLNSNWTPDNAAMIRKINQAIDKDIASAGGGDLLKKADALHQAEKELFASKGIKKIFGEIDSNGVQTATAYEKIPTTLNSMPIDEWKHIYNTADKFSKEFIEVKGQQLKIPLELRQAAQSAKDEMAGSIAREVYQAGANKVGVWNQNSANSVLNARAEKIKHAFSPEEQKAFHTLNYGGHIMPGVHPYEGAGLQTERVGKLTNRLPGIGREMGAFTGIPFAATIGEKLGEKSKNALTNRKLAQEASVLEKKMKENAKKGTSLKDIGKQ